MGSGRSWKRARYRFSTEWAFLIEAMTKAVSAGCAIFSHQFKGAASRVPVEATAFGLRRDHVLIEILASFPDRPGGSEERRHQRWVRDARRAFDAIALPGGYPNLLASGDTDRVAECFGANVERLARVKQLYDPENVFCSAIPLPAHLPLYVLAETRSDIWCLVERSGLVSEAIRLRSFSPLLSALHRGTSAVEFSRSTSVPDVAAPHCIL